MTEFKNRILQGDSLEVLQDLPDGLVNTCVTSPPYWGLRDYGVDGQLGAENTPDEYIERMVTIFREVRRVLRDDGTLWLNLGDSYAAGGNIRNTGRNDENPADIARRAELYSTGKPKALSGGNKPGTIKVEYGLRPKNLVGIPWRVALALQADGWYLRSDIIWHKPNAMPESVRDRPTKAHEYIFLLTKNPKYFYDHEAIKEPLSPNSDVNYRRKLRVGKQYNVKKPYKDNTPFTAGSKNGEPITKRNRRSVWSVSTKPFKGAHFAVFPPDLIEPCILAGAPEGGIVLDPFFGSGTTGLVARKHGRHYVGIELNSGYIELSRKRIKSELGAK